jgi:hypothetical protein
MSADDWLLDSITGFLRSPGWALPVMSFIDENCIVFDNEDENKFAFTDIHAAFKEMVEMLIEMHLEVGQRPFPFRSSLFLPVHSPFAPKGSSPPTPSPTHRRAWA